MANEDAFTQARECFNEMLGWLEGNESAQLSHADLEDEIVRRGRETQRLAFQDHLDLRALRERRVRVVDADGVAHGAVEAAHRRQLQTVVGAVSVERLAYRHVGSANLHPADAALNLPDQLHSHGLRRLAAVESTRGSFDEAAAAIERGTGVAVAKRQVEDLTSRAAHDVEAFYEKREHAEVHESDVLHSLSGQRTNHRLVLTTHRRAIDQPTSLSTSSRIRSRSAAVSAKTLSEDRSPGSAWARR